MAARFDGEGGDSAAVRRLARILTRHERVLRGLATTPQLTNSSIPVVVEDGADPVDVPVPVALGQGVQAAAVVGDLDERLGGAEGELADQAERLDEAAERIGEAFDLAESKGSVYRQDTAPSPVPTSGVWYDTSDGNKPYVVTGGPQSYGFESTVLPFTKPSSVHGFSRSTGQAHSGAASVARITSTGEAAAVFQKPLASIGDAAVAVQASVRIAAGVGALPSGVCLGCDATGGGGVRLVVDPRNGTGDTAALQLRDGAGNVLASDTSVTINTDEWYTIMLVVGAGGGVAIGALLSEEDGTTLVQFSATGLTVELADHAALYTLGRMYADDVAITDAAKWALAQDGDIEQAKQDAALALEAANGATKILHSTGTPSGDAPDGSIWWRHEGSTSGPVVGQWNRVDGEWVEVPFSSDAIANLDVGKLTAGGAVISDVVAQNIASATGQFLELDVGNLVASDAVLDEAVANKIWSDSVVTNLATAQELIAGEALIRGTVTANAIAADAIDGMEIRGAYIEGPVIASSANLGTGANVLNDPDLTSQVDTAWVASGHLGSASGRYHDDLLTWDQTWTWKSSTGSSTQSRRNVGRIRMRSSLKPIPGRTTGTATFKNDLWLDTAVTNIADPFTFENNVISGQAGGTADPSIRAADMGAPLSGSEVTTYLTNSAIFAVTSGQVWNYRLGYDTGVTGASSFWEATLELVDTNGTVRWSRALTAAERENAIEVRGTFTASFSASVQFRVKTTYTASGGGGLYRRATDGSYARQYQAGSLAVDDDFTPTASLWWVMGAKRWPSRWTTSSSNPPPDNEAYENTELSREYGVRSLFRLTLTSAQFSQVTPEKGFRLDSEKGLELFNSNGATTGRLNGESNFLAGSFATAESGERVELSSGSLKWFDSASVLQGGVGAGRVTDWNDVTIPGRYWSVGAANQPYDGSSLVHFGDVAMGYANGQVVLWQDVSYGGSDHAASLRRYRKANGSWTEWNRVGPVTGTYNAGSNITAGSFYDQTITFPTGRFSSAPKIVAGTNQVRVLAACTSKNVGTATIRVFNVSTGTAAGACMVDWLATD